jgi:uncharacterized protein (DUF983 family)
MTSDNPKPEGQPGTEKSEVQAALRGLCPQCGERTLFAGFADFAPKCSNCGLDYGQFNVGDGPTVFLTMGIGTLAVLLGLWVHFTFEPPLWLLAVLLTPLILGSTLFGLRISKAWLLQAEFWRKATPADTRDVLHPDHDRGEK